ncbi:MAG TPA: hypothetical protein VMN39_12810 [Longimicrobiaceae bacterium]|nr:hypothetical protein [Longimicrobiaceae bacterium]
MSLLLFGYLYATVAFIVAGYVYFRGVIARPLPKQFALEDRAVLSIVAIGVGLFWPLFTPALLALWTVNAARLAGAHFPRLALRALREVRVRS